MIKASATPPRTTGILPWVILAICAAIFLYVATIGFGDPLFEDAGFRQTQTAISTEYIIRDGFKIAYETPILGAPWSLPFEFPTYQFTVAALVKITGLRLDPAGRLVSLLFAGGTFILLFVFVRQLSGSITGAVFAVSLALVTPVYLYFSRTFMIESMALCFALGLLVATNSFLQRPRIAALCWITFAGLFAGLTKATTYAVALAAVATLLLFSARATWSRIHQSRRPWVLLGGLSIALALPFALTLAWTAWTDTVKSRNELAVFLTSSSLHDWNYGTAAQRGDVNVWRNIGITISEGVMGSPLIWLLVVLAAAIGVMVRTRVRQVRGIGALSIACLAAFVAGPFVFLNLYHIHPYYFYANSVYATAIVGALLGLVWDENRFLAKLGAMMALLLLVTVNVHAYSMRFYYQQAKPNLALLQLTKKIAAITPRDAVLLIDGGDWDSSLAYYADRRAVMNRDMRATSDPVMQRAFSRLGQPIGAIIAVAGARVDPEFLAGQFRGLHRSFERAYTSDLGDIYLPVATVAQNHESQQSTATNASAAAFVARPTPIEARALPSLPHGARTGSSNTATAGSALAR